MSQVMGMPNGADLHIRTPRREDGAAVWRLVGDTGGLEQNSAYAYLLMCTHFQNTCLVAERRDRLLGCVLAYRPPREADSVFVWQVGVASDQRGAGLGSRMLDELVKLPACRQLHFLTASVSAGNRASHALFSGFARRHGAALTEKEFLPESCFPQKHAAEPLLRIGPLH
jgi:L-2,4-diaminobutyric acid acetyltransferase